MTHVFRPAPLFAIVIAVLSAPAALARDDIRVERVHFEPGASSATVEATIKGYETVDYVLGARKGQLMNAGLASDNSANYFNILAPGEDEVAFFNGSISENQFEGPLPETGDYKLRVYLMRSAARRNEVAKYRLEMIITDAHAAKSAAGNTDALVPGSDYHATGEVPCAMTAAQPTGSCKFGVQREGGGSGIVTVTKPDGRTRAIFFENGRATGCDASEADPGEFAATRSGDLTTVRIGEERYEIPDAVVSGG